MKAGLARAVMAVAVCSLGRSRRDWALAMEAELEAAVADGRPLAFALGCLVAAWREMPGQSEGRFALANHAVALGLLIPMAVFQLECVVGLPYLSLAKSGLFSLALPSGAHDLYLAEAHRSALLPILALWSVLGMGHLRLAWLVLERDWPGVARVAALMVAVSATLVIFAGVLLLDDAGVGLQALLLTIELAAIYALCRWDARVFPDAIGHGLSRALDS